MYKININADHFVFSVTEAWGMMTTEKKADGQKILKDVFKDTLKKAFDAEKNLAYDEHRFPEYTEIIKSTNELLRSSMFVFTDLYTKGNDSLFEPTAFGGLNEKEMAELTKGESLWSMDQKSDQAWEIQSKPAKDIAAKWLNENRPYETMIHEMNDLIEANKDNKLERKEVINKLAAAEWLLINNEKMMIEDPEDPLNPIPNWGNRYWKAITQAREALGIDPHTSVRELIQGEYAAMSQATESTRYNEVQIKDSVLDPEQRQLCDSMEKQKEEFAIQSEHTINISLDNEKRMQELEMPGDKVKICVEEENEARKMKEAPKNTAFIVERTASFSIGAKLE